jgi:Spermidine/putrescine-binding periplasmic protein
MKKLCLSALCVLVLASVFTVTTAFAASAGKVVVYNWSEYIPQDVLDDFTKETGIEVVYSTFESNEAMLAKVKLMQGKGYDVVVPSSYFLAMMQKEGLLQELDKGKLTNMVHLDKGWLDQDFDKGNKFSVPYMWGFVGLAHNAKHVKPEKLTKWKDLLRPELKGKIILTDDLRDAFGLALLSVGLKTDETTEAGLKKAYEFLKKVKKSVRIFDVTAIKQALISEEVWVGPIWNGDFLVAQEENKDLQFVFPEEGIILWMDNFVITKGAENVDNAYAFINYMLRPEVAAKCVEEYKYSTPNKSALQLLPDELKNSPVLIPTAEQIAKGTFPNDLGDALPLYQKYWEKLKTGN